LDQFIPSLPPFSSCLRVSQYPPDILFGYISERTIHIYELVLESDVPSASSIRQYTIDHFTFRWFDFVNGLSTPDILEGQSPHPIPQVAVICQEDESKNFDLQWWSLVRCKNMGHVVFSGKFVDAAVSPVDPNRVAVLTSNNLAFYDRAETGEISLHFFAHNGPIKLKRILWSPFGSRVKLIDPKGEHVLSFVEVSANVWCGEQEGKS
jgi:hypothetical protein